MIDEADDAEAEPEAEAEADDAEAAAANRDEKPSDDDDVKPDDADGAESLRVFGGPKRMSCGGTEMSSSPLSSLIRSNTRDDGEASACSCSS